MSNVAPFPMRKRAPRAPRIMNAKAEVGAHVLSSIGENLLTPREIELNDISRMSEVSYNHRVELVRADSYPTRKVDWGIVHECYRLQLQVCDCMKRAIIWT